MWPAGGGSAAWAAAGLAAAALAVLGDLRPDVLPVWAAVVFPGPFHGSVRRCLFEEPPR